MAKPMAESLPDIMQYESNIWAIADDLRAVGIKQSDCPVFMMPFFALMMLEGRMRNTVKKLKAEYEIAEDENPEGFDKLFIAEEVGFNEYIVLERKTLADICRNDTTFYTDFRSYLESFDEDIKRLLGVGCGPHDQKFLNMDGIAAELHGKHILLAVATKWASVDLSGYDNSAITTLEEHIKRKWADISASTAGEQYTPDDIISLIAEIVADKIDKPKNRMIHIYDPTCGGANLLFGVEDRLRKNAGYDHIASYGSEYNDALYALAAIESRFRESSKIKYGNTLTNVPFDGTLFDAIVANPPYGTKWTGYEREIRNDQRGQFAGGLPGTGDGQLLFMQHILWQLDSQGLAVVVADGSTLFSGDAGSGESNIRKYVFDRDWVEALVQMPQQEFFNTGITTYLWILNKNKAPERRNLVALIDASKGWSSLKKSKGDKRREMTETHRATIVGALRDFHPSEICKIFDREHFYYNKQKVFLTELDENGKSISPEDCVSFKISAFSCGDLRLETRDMSPERAKEVLASAKACNQTSGIALSADDGKRYAFDPDKKTIAVFNELDSATRLLGRGVFGFSLCQGSARGSKTLKATIAPEIATDYEIITHRFDPDANKAEIAAFVKKYIFKPCELGENKVGVELNFNKEFYVPEKLDSVEDILAEIKALDAELKEVTL